MTAWILHICIGVSWVGCASAMTSRYPTEDACYRALREMRTGDMVSESSKKRNVVAHCAPEVKK